MSYSAAAAAASSAPILPLSQRTQLFADQVDRTLAKHNWHGHIVTRDNMQVPLDVFIQAFDQETAVPLSPLEQTTFQRFKANSESATFNTFLNEFIGKRVTVPGGDVPIYNAHCNPEVTRKHALHYFGLGCDPTKKEEWMASFSKKGLYIVLNTDYYYGTDIPKRLRAEYQKAPPMTFEGRFLIVDGNMTYSIILNKLNNGTLFPLVSINCFDEVTGEVILNIDAYSRTDATRKVIVDLATVPSDALTVLNQQRKAAFEILKAQYKELKQAYKAEKAKNWFYE